MRTGPYTLNLFEWEQLDMFLDRKNILGISMHKLLIRNNPSSVYTTLQQATVTGSDKPIAQVWKNL